MKKTLFVCLFATWTLCGAALAHAEDALPHALRIDPATTSVPLGKAKLSVESVARSGQGDAWQGSYKVEVSPLGFAGEEGKLTINLPGESLRKLTSGQQVDFSGQAASTNGNNSTVQGTATPAGGSKDSGAIRVRINSKKGKLVFKTTYHLVK